MDYFEWIKSDFVSAVKEWRKNYKTLDYQQWQIANDIGMQHAGKRTWERPPQSYEMEILNLIQGDNNIKILDAGCGVGFVLYQLHKRGFKYLAGIDSSPTCIDECHNRSKRQEINDISWSTMDISKNTIPDNTADFVLCCEVLEHVINPIKIINELYRILKPGGVALFSVPHQERRTSWMHINYFYLKTSMPENWPSKEYNIFEASDLFRLSKLRNVTVGTDKRKKFILVRGMK